MEIKENIAEQKSYQFALEIVKLYKANAKEHKEFVLGRQLLRAGTSVGANVAESVGGISDKDFSHKLSIAYKEAREAKYWLRLLHDSDYLNTERFNVLFEMADELCRILYTTLRSTGRTK